MRDIKNYWQQRPSFFVSPPTLDEYEQALTRLDDLTPNVEGAIRKARVMLLCHPTVCYVAGAVTEVDEITKIRYEIAAKIANANRIFAYVPHLHGTDPIKNPDVSPREVRDIDFLWAVVVPKFHINFLVPKSASWTEEGWAEDHFIPVIYCVPQNEKISRLIRGMRNMLSTIIYSTLDDCYRKLAIVFRLVSLWQADNPDRPFTDFAEEHYPLRIELGS